MCICTHCETGKTKNKNCCGTKENRKIKIKCERWDEMDNEMKSKAKNKHLYQIKKTARRNKCTGQVQITILNK